MGYGTQEWFSVKSENYDTCGIPSKFKLLTSSSTGCYILYNNECNITSAWSNQ